MEEELTEKQIEKKEALEFVERLEAANKQTEELQANQVKLNMENSLGGETEAGQLPVEPKKLSDTDYAEQVRLGLVNPLQEDGFI